MKIFIKPSGVELPVNPESWEYVISLGWKPKEEEAQDRQERPTDAPRRGRPPKQMD